jgi:hypothetical protein
MGHGDSQAETYAYQSQPVQAHRENVIAQLALNYLAEGLTILLDGGREFSVDRLGGNQDGKTLSCRPLGIGFKCP